VTAAREARALRVCAVIQSFRPVLGGAQMQLERLLPLLAARGVAVEVVARGARGAPREEQVDGGLVRRTLVAGDSAAASLDYALEAGARLTRRRRRFDVVHAHGALSEGAIATFGRALGMAMLVKILRAGPEGDVRTLLRRPAGRRRLALLVRRAWFVAIAPEVRAELQDVGVPAARIFDIPNGVDPATFRPAREDERRALRDRLALPPGPLLVYTGRLDSVKRLEVLVRMLAAMDGCRLVLVGSGPDRARLESLAAETGVRDRVWFAGAVSSVADYLRAADAFVTPSGAEGLSNALLEAMACGLPCLAAPASGVRSLLADGRGFVVEDEASWARTVAAIVAAPGAADNAGAKAARYVRAHLSLDRTADALRAAYERLLRGAEG
jgi:glycosyltransferase involved in cell wall biosynthesis